jgi:hypothetical protein
MDAKHILYKDFGMNISASAKNDLMRIQPCMKMERIITELATKANLDINGSDGETNIDIEPHYRLSIKKIEGNLIAVSDYNVSSGGLEPDTDAVFLMIGSYWYPIFFVNQTQYEEPVEFDSDEQIISILENMQSTVVYTSEWADIIIAKGFSDKV